ncbi:MAG: class I SAM-dependent methyltransferase [Acidimicrobiia bacterium]|nr:class I SAM-dependent methyltransferase [Acidimicrobiia bacterium]
MGAREHWNAVYEEQPTTLLGWYEPEPSTLALVIEYSTPLSSVIDIGGGDSRLVDELLLRDYGELTVLDLSEVALDRVRSRLGDRADEVDWVVTDLTSFEPARTWDLWHDRAVFHFLVNAADQETYRALAAKAIRPGGYLIVAAFGTDGPVECAGLPVCRYDTESLPALFTPQFEPVWSGPLAAVSADRGDQRPYVAAVLRRTTV